jgi:hypothetical protein
MARVGGEQTPQVMRRFLIHAVMAIWTLPVLWAFSPAPSATLYRLLPSQCSQCQLGANIVRTPRQMAAVSVGVRNCPSPSADGRDAQNNVT